MIKDLNRHGVNTRTINANIIHNRKGEGPMPTLDWFQFDVTPLDSGYKLIS